MMNIEPITEVIQEIVREDEERGICDETKYSSGIINLYEKKSFTGT